jgi:hypothetical protein
MYMRTTTCRIEGGGGTLQIAPTVFCQVNTKRGAPGWGDTVGRGEGGEVLVDSSPDFARSYGASGLAPINNEHLHRHGLGRDELHALLLQLVEHAHAQEDLGLADSVLLLRHRGYLKQRLDAILAADARCVLRQDDVVARDELGEEEMVGEALARGLHRYGKGGESG